MSAPAPARTHSGAEHAPRFVPEQEVRELFPVSVALPVLREVMAAFSAGEVTQPVRTVLRPPARDGADPGLFGSMPAHVPVEGRYWFGIKSVVVRADNPARGLDTHVGTVTVFAPDTGLPVAVMPASVITELRTAAVSAVATAALARPDADTLAVIGAGAQARAHVGAMLAVRPVRQVSVWARNADRAREFAAWITEVHGLPVTVCDSVREATASAALVCTTTSAREPVLDLADLAPGAHVNAVGACQPGARELSSALVAGAAVFLDSRDAAAGEASELLVPVGEGLIPVDHPRAELGAVLRGTAEGRRSADEITVYLSLGLAVQDVAAGVTVARCAAERDTGATGDTWWSPAV
ncbi:ornithine cyclodeaminase family protein [Kitasatospora sp. NBC_00315]|uniref:ornithine cyclodeaminase family protein n=1 Tax=Kitasatospora sp. NBC_00315 TaxID=2975963 RepID=UPI003254EC3A